MTTPDNVLNFWASIGPKGWWTKDDNIDRQIIEKFSDTHAQATAGDLDHWAETADGALALIIVLDQFSRNMFRGDSKTFAQDAKALQLAKKAIGAGFDKRAMKELRLFFYLPYEHSESILDQKQSVLLMHSLGYNPDNMKAVLEHREIIERFGRFPHRNTVLGRHTTPAEQAYLDSGGFKG